MNFNSLNSKIETLANKIASAKPFFGTPSKSHWDSAFDLIKEIFDDFRNTRYPTKQERDIAWQKFYVLKNQAYEIHNSQMHDHSKKHFDDLMYRLKSVDYYALADFLIGEVMSLGLMKETKEEMIVKGQELRIISQEFSSIKGEMTREHKNEVFRRILEIRKNHDGFWEKFKSYSSERSQLYEDRQREKEEKRLKSQIKKQNIENNLSSNESKLAKAKDAKERFMDKRNDLQDKIYDSTNDNWKYKAYDWLDEFDAKIRDIEEHISRLETWIDEDREKLRNWRD